LPGFGWWVEAVEIVFPDDDRESLVRIVVA